MTTNNTVVHIQYINGGRRGNTIITNTRIEFLCNLQEAEKSNEMQQIQLSLLYLQRKYLNCISLEDQTGLKLKLIRLP